MFSLEQIKPHTELFQNKLTLQSYLLYFQKLIQGLVERRHLKMKECFGQFSFDPTQRCNIVTPSSTKVVQNKI